MVVAAVVAPANRRQVEEAGITRVRRTSFPLLHQRRVPRVGTPGPIHVAKRRHGFQRVRRVEHARVPALPA